jgi:urease accessory protein
MPRAAAIRPAGSFDPASATDSVILDFDGRHRRRILLRTAGGTDLLLDLPEAAHLRDGDGLLLDDGRIVRVAAAPEHLVEIRAGTPAELLRIAWHLGNRHLPTQLLSGALRIRTDHVIEAMVTGLGGWVAPVDAPFDPEGGAYGPASTHDHAHALNHGRHRHDHG